MIVIVPSRGRPHNIAALVEAAMDAQTMMVDWWVCVDQDDETLPGYREVLDGVNSFGLIVGPRLRLGGTLNVAAQFAARFTSVIGFMGDDHRPRTPGWDGEVVGGRRPLDVAYCNDLVQGERLPTAVFLDARIVRTLGYMAPPTLTHLYLDNFWKRLGERLGTLRYLPDAVIEHCHPTAGTAPDDAGYAEVNAASMYAADAQAFEVYLADQFEADVAKLEALR